jgi:hypothetical protein
MPVVAVDPGGEVREEIAPDFGSALHMLVREELDLDEDDRVGSSGRGRRRS